MLIVEFLKEYKHTSRRTWEPGVTSVLDRDFAKELAQKGIVKIIDPGCGCPGMDDATLLRYAQLNGRAELEEENGTDEAEEE